MRPGAWGAAALGGLLSLTAACVHAGRDYELGRKAQALQDYDSALVDYERALRTDPHNAQYKLSVASMRFQAAQAHVETGERLMAKGDLNDVEMALGNFQRAVDIDPSSAIANQMTDKAVERIAELNKAATQPAPPPAESELEKLSAMPPVLKPLPNQTINLTLTNDARIVYESIAKLAGLTVLFDPSIVAKPISVELPNVTLEQALDATALETGTFWKPVTSNIIFVAMDSPTNRAKYADEIVKTFYLKNVTKPADLSEVAGVLRQLLQGATGKIQQVNSLNAIVVRDTPDRVAVAEKVLDDIDKAKAEVLLQVSVLEVNRNRLRDLGIQPGTSATLAFTPRTAVQPPSSSSSSSSSSTGSNTSAAQITLNNLKRLSSADYSLTLPGAAVQALLTDSTTKIIQNPEIRITDGQPASLKIGDKIPEATGSYLAGFGGTTASGGLAPLSSTQFNYLDVGVNINVTPYVYPNGDVSLVLTIEDSSVTGFENIGGIQEPTLSQRIIGPDEIRLKSGEVQVLGGLMSTTTSKTVSGWPGFDRIPFLKYFFTQQDVQTQNDEVLFVLTPHVVRMPNITAENLRSLFTGSEQDIQILPKIEAASGDSAGASIFPPAGKQAEAAPAPPATASAGPGGLLAFEPPTLTLPPGQTATVALVVRNASDLYSIPLILHYDPKVVAIEDVRDGGFLSGGTQVVSIFHKEDAQKGEAVVSAMRQPNGGGVNGSGTLVGIVVKALAPGASPLEIEEVGARDSKQQPLTFQTQSATIRVGGSR